MSNDLHIDDKIINDLFETAVNENEQKSTGYIPKLTMEYVLSRIDAIVNDTEHIHEAIKAIKEIPDLKLTDGLMNFGGDYAGQAKAEAISNTIQSRETTNQQLIRLFEKMYDDLKPKEASEEIFKFQNLVDSLSKFPTEESVNILRNAAHQMFIKPGTGIAFSSK